MRKSTNFNLNLVEGSDLVNPLVQDVPNYEKIDEQMYANQCNSIGIATELKSGTVHAITRTIPNAPMFRFKATSNFTAGDTFTVDGIQVSALTPSGETLASGCYVIGIEVLCVLRETLLTIYVSGGTVTTAQDSEKLGGQLPEYYGTAEDVSEAISTAQSANQLTLTLQQSVENISNNLGKVDLTTQEVLIGTYLGKPLYRRIYHASIGSVSITNTDFIVDNNFGSDNISELLRFSGSAHASRIDVNQYIPFGYFDPASGTASGIQLYIGGDFIEIYKGSSSQNINGYDIVLEYTKS